MTGAAEATIRATAITSSFMRVLRLGFGRLISGSVGWPSVPFEHLLGGPCGAVCPIAVGYGVGALGDALRLLKGRATSAGAGTLMIEVTVKCRTRNFAPAPSFNVRYGSVADIGGSVTDVCFAPKSGHAPACQKCR